MFTGIIQALGKVQDAMRQRDDLRLRIATGKLDLTTVTSGDSIAVSGVCLTIAELLQEGFYADISAETLSCTALSDLRTGDQVNLEKALTLSTPLGGHLVSGHVDGIAEVVALTEVGQSLRFTIALPRSLSKYIAPKGSVCIDGVSLTVNAVEGDSFEVNIIPHTLRETTLGAYTVGRRVNIEVDLVARYIERLLLGEDTVHKGGVSYELLARHGFINE